MKTIILVLFSMTLAAAELPSVAQAAIKKSQAVFDKIDAEALVKTNKEREALVAILTKSLDVSTKASDLEGAIAIKKKIDEIKALIKSASPTKDQPKWWTKVTTTAQWNAAEGKVIKVPASTVFDTGVTVADGESYVVLADPAGAWATGPSEPKFGFAGDASQTHSSVVGLTAQFMAMIALIDGKPQEVAKDPVISTAGHVFIRSNDSSPTNNIGEIRVKIIPVDQK